MKNIGSVIAGVTVVALSVLVASGASASGHPEFDGLGHDSDTIAALPGVVRASPATRAKLVEVARRLGTDRDSLAVVIEHESGWDPAIQAPDGDSGLIQLTTFANLPGFKTQGDVNKILQKGSVWQLENVVLPYFSRFGQSVLANASPGKLLLANGFPAAVSKPDDHVLGVRDETDPETGKLTARGKLYKAVSDYDHAQKGFVTVGDVKTEAMMTLATANGKRITVGGRIS